MVQAPSKRILLVEDETSVREVLKRKLIQDGFDTQVAEDGEEAIASLDKVIPDLILLDVIMPKMNGFDFLEKIRSDKRYNDIPVIIISNLEGDNDRATGKNLGITDYIVKSNISLRELMSLIRKVV